MDAFGMHERLIRDYRSFSEGFVRIHDERVREHVQPEAAQGEYRTRRLIFDVDDRMAKLIRTGEPFHILDPPVGKGSRHPAAATEKE